MGRTEREGNPQNLRIAGFLKRSAVNGPGVRAVIWVQGCPIRCEGCFNTDLWDYYGGDVVTTGQLFDEILSIEGIGGVTFSGGEPFFQADALAELAGMIHAGGLSVVTFTGYPYAALTATKKASWKRLLSETDLLISGPYFARMPGGHSTIGSPNKEIHVLSDRIFFPSNNPGRTSVQVEFTIAPDGTLSITGFPDPAVAGRITTDGTGGGR